ncbi:MAG: hypothetical protein OXH90_08345 [Paracoccaceae bacterium]|nr:hypothetical protein [Paracoccaceae bacterium]MDE2915674.1 hypothetical protein [Paracoccaceae bacterium]
MVGTNIQAKTIDEEITEYVIHPCMVKAGRMNGMDHGMTDDEIIAFMTIQTGDWDDIREAIKRFVGHLPESDRRIMYGMVYTNGCEKR